MKAVDQKLWDYLSGTFEIPFSFTSVERMSGEGAIAFHGNDENQNQFDLSLRPVMAHVVGVDIVGYSLRSAEAQLLLTGLLFSRIQATVRLLRQVSWLSPDQPQVSIPLGDGAMLVFGEAENSLQSSLAFIYCLNMFIEDINRQYLYSATTREFETSQPYPVLPIHCRYVLNSGEVIPIKDINDVDNAVGTGLVRCARILAASKGAHFLVDSEVIADLNRQGGIDGVSHLGNPWNWEQSFHSALMPETKVKSASLRFFNVFGKYKATALLHERGSDGPSAGATYSIGSHDVNTICS